MSTYCGLCLIEENLLWESPTPANTVYAALNKCFSNKTLIILSAERLSHTLYVGGAGQMLHKISKLFQLRAHKGQYISLELHSKLGVNVAWLLERHNAFTFKIKYNTYPICEYKNLYVFNIIVINT